MKTTIYIAILFCLSISCKKPKQPPIAPPKQCKNSFIALKQVGTDSLRLIDVDTATGESTNTIYNFVIRKQGNGVYIPEEKLYYTFQQDEVGKIFLVRYHLDNNQTDILNYSGAISSLPDPASGQILYSAKYAKLFYIHVYAVSSSQESKIFELIIDGTTCTEKEVSPSRGISSVIVWPIINEATGELCFSTYGEGYQVYNPGTRKTAKHIPNNSIISTIFNPNDSMFYGIDYQHNPVSFCKRTPQTGDVITIKPLSINFDRYYIHSTFDVCKNQYILQIGGHIFDGSTANIYWIDVKTGNVVKEIHSNDRYLELTSTEK